MASRRTPPLCEAAYAGDLSAIEGLIRGGADVNAAGPLGRTALMNAVIAKDVTCASALIAGGADVNARDDNGWTALHFVAQANDKALAILLIDARANPNLQDGNGNTALFRAVFSYRSEAEVVSVLLEAGASPDIKNAAGVSPRTLARTIANYDVRKFFTE